MKPFSFVVLWGVLVVIAVNACSAAKNGAAIIAIKMTGTAALKTGPCNLFTVSAVDATGNAVALSTALTVTLGGGGNGTFHSTLASCAANQAITTLTIPIAATQATVYFKDYTAETLTLTAVQAVGQSGSFAVTLTADPFVNASGLAGGQVYGVDFLPDGKFYVGGDFLQYGGTSVARVVRLQPNGALDATFIAPSFNNAVHSVLAATDGSGNVYAAGEFSDVGGVANNDLLVRLSSDGTLVGGPPAISSASYGLALAHPTGDATHILFGGSWTNYGTSGFANFLRLNADLTADTWPHTPGVGRGAPEKAKAIVPTSDGGVYVAGPSLASCDGVAVSGLCRLKADGTIDTAFSVAAGSFASGGPQTLALVPDGSGDVLVGGNFTQYKTNSSPGLVRIKADGSYVPSLAVGAGFAGFPGATVFAVLPLDDGTNDILVGGYFTTYNGTTTGTLVRLKADGSRVSTFTGPPTTLQAIRTIRQVPDGSNRVLVGGDLVSYGGGAVSKLIRIRASGQLD